MLPSIAKFFGIAVVFDILLYFMNEWDVIFIYWNEVEMHFLGIAFFVFGSAAIWFYHVLQSRADLRAMTVAAGLRDGQTS